MKKITIHKNKLRKLLLEDEKTNLGEEKYKRWVDIPEFIQILVDDNWVQIEDENLIIR